MVGDGRATVAPPCGFSGGCCGGAESAPPWPAPLTGLPWALLHRSSTY